ncbi:MAG: hypothetical protein VCC00_01570 [Deltaproteobacteria bacterium]
MAKLIYSREELLAEHAYARPHEAAGRKLHGGFSADGAYISPRTLHREGAIQAWREALLARGGSLLSCDLSLLPSPIYPNAAQQSVLLAAGLGQNLWNSLSITGAIEGNGRLLIDLVSPRFDKVIQEDITETAIGHLHKGLLVAHGMDEGGAPGSGLGAHDEMWFALRDLALGHDTWPMPEVPDSISRPEAGRLFPMLPEPIEGMLSLLMNVLLIEVRAEKVFTASQDLLSRPELFSQPAENVALAHTLIERIRIDEAVHVDYLQLVLSELRHLTFLTGEGKEVAGAAIIDPAWQTVVQWHGVENPRLAREQQVPLMREHILTHAEGEALLARFEAQNEPLAAA